MGGPGPCSVHCDMFSDSEEDNSDNGGNQSPDSTREIFGKRRRLNSDEEVQARSRSSTPAFSSRANSLMREDSENEESQVVSKQYKKFYRSRSPSLSQSRSRSPSISRSRSKSLSRSQSRSRSRSLSRSKSRSRSNSSRSFINSRSPSPVNRQLKKKRIAPTNKTLDLISVNQRMKIMIQRFRQILKLQSELLRKQIM